MSELIGMFPLYTLKIISIQINIQVQSHFLRLRSYTSRYIPTLRIISIQINIQVKSHFILSKSYSYPSRSISNPGISLLCAIKIVYIQINIQVQSHFMFTRYIHLSGSISRYRSTLYYQDQIYPDQYPFYLYLGGCNIEVLRLQFHSGKLNQARVQMHFSLLV